MRDEVLAFARDVAVAMSIIPVVVGALIVLSEIFSRWVGVDEQAEHDPWGDD